MINFFAGSVPIVIKKRIYIVFKLNTNKRHAKLTKFRIEITKHLKEAKILDTENINDL